MQGIKENKNLFHFLSQIDTKFKFNFRLDLDKKYLNFELEIPLLRINAQYNLKGNILLLPLVGNGDVVMALKNVKTSVYTKITTKNMPEVSIILKFFFFFC